MCMYENPSLPSDMNLEYRINFLVHFLNITNVAAKVSFICHIENLRNLIY